MNRIIFTSLIIGLTIISCTNSKKGEKNKDSNTSKLTKKEFFLSKMKEKKFLLENNGPCDDALEDTIH